MRSLYILYRAFRAHLLQKRLAKQADQFVEDVNDMIAALPEDRRKLLDAEMARLDREYPIKWGSD